MGKLMAMGIAPAIKCLGLGQAEAECHGHSLGSIAFGLVMGMAMAMGIAWAINCLGLGQRRDELSLALGLAAAEWALAWAWSLTSGPHRAPASGPYRKSWRHDLLQTHMYGYSYHRWA